MYHGNIDIMATFFISLKGGLILVNSLASSLFSSSSKLLSIGAWRRVCCKNDIWSDKYHFLLGFAEIHLEAGQIWSVWTPQTSPLLLDDFRCWKKSDAAVYTREICLNPKSFRLDLMKTVNGNGIYLMGINRVSGKIIIITNDSLFGPVSIKNMRQICK